MEFLFYFFIFSFSTITDGDFDYYDESKTDLIKAHSDQLTLVIPDSVEQIEQYAFRSSTSSVLSFGSSTHLKVLKRYAIGQSPFVTVTIPRSVETFEDGIFYQSNKLENVIIEGSITTLGLRFFHQCKNLKSVTIGNTQILDNHVLDFTLSSVTTISEYAFNQVNISKITIPNTFQDLLVGSFSTIPDVETIEIKKDITIFPDNLFYEDAKLQNIIINGQTVLQNGNLDFTNSIIDSIGAQCFFGTKIKYVNAPSSVSNVNVRAFIGASELISVNINVKINKSAIYHLQSCLLLINFTIENSPYILNQVIDLSSYEITNIGRTVFQKSSLKGIVLPQSCDLFEIDSFQHCAFLETLEIGSSLQNIPDALFENTSSFKKLIIGTKTVYENQILDFTGSSITNIGSYAFQKFGNILKIVFPSGISVSVHSFVDNTNLNTVEFSGKPISFSVSIFSGCSNLQTFRLPSGTNCNTFSEFDFSLVFSNTPIASQSWCFGQPDNPDNSESSSSDSSSGLSSGYVALIVIIVIVVIILICVGVFLFIKHSRDNGSGFVNEQLLN